MLSFERLAAALGAAWRFLTGERDAAQEAISRVFEDNFDGLVIIGADGRIIAASQVASRLLLGGSGSIVGRPASAVLPEPMLAAVQRSFAEGRRGVPSPMAIAYVGDPREGGYIVQYVTNLSELSARSGPVPKRVVHLTFWDETERRRREEELAFIGTHDNVTGALTRSELIRIVNSALASSRSRAVGLSLLVVDLRRFKFVNATLGPTHGDSLLKMAVSRIKAVGVETIARLAGDRFALVRHGRWSPEQVEGLCEGLIARLTLPYGLGAQRAVIGASIGVTHTDISGYDPEVLLTHGEIALDVAKAMPGSHFATFTPEMDQRLKERRAMDVALRQARENQQFSIVYEPQCALDSGALVGVEARLRWTHPELGVLPPERFLAASEENGEIVEIGRWALGEACREAAGWPFQTRLAVNVSPLQFELADMVAEVRQALRISGLAAHRLDIEITERALTKSPHVADAVAQLRALGVGVVLDDFGAALASLSLLGRLPVDKVKLDRGFVAGLPGSTETEAIITAVTTLSETLNKVVIAEGIENADQVWMLRMMGCRIGQGPHFGLARRGAEMAAWFDAPQPGHSAVG